MKLQESISPTYLRTAFTPVAPKSVRIQSSCQYLFTLLGSTGVKAARRMLMKLTPGVDFYNILCATFSCENVIYSYSLLTLWVCIFGHKEIGEKAAHEMLRNSCNLWGSITVPSTSWKTGFDMAVVDINKNFLYYWVRPAFWEFDGTWSFPLLL